MGTLKVLFVCMGNICRSPTAEGVMRQRLQQQGLVALDLSNGALVVLRPPAPAAGGVRCLVVSLHLQAPSPL